MIELEVGVELEPEAMGRRLIARGLRIVGRDILALSVVMGLRDG